MFGLLHSALGETDCEQAHIKTERASIDLHRSRSHRGEGGNVEGVDAALPLKFLVNLYLFSLDRALWDSRNLSKFLNGKIAEEWLREPRRNFGGAASQDFRDRTVRTSPRACMQTSTPLA